MIVSAASGLFFSRLDKGENHYFVIALFVVVFNINGQISYDQRLADIDRFIPCGPFFVFSRNIVHSFEVTTNANQVCHNFVPHSLFDILGFPRLTTKLTCHQRNMSASPDHRETPANRIKLVNCRRSGGQVERLVRLSLPSFL